MKKRNTKKIKKNVNHVEISSKVQQVQNIKNHVEILKLTGNVTAYFLNLSFFVYCLLLTVIPFSDIIAQTIAPVLACFSQGAAIRGMIMSAKQLKPNQIVIKG